MSPASHRPGDPRITVLASRVGADEKRLLDTFERRGVAVECVDSRRLRFSAGHRDRAPHVVVNREIGQVRAGYAAHCLEAEGALVLNSAAATDVCGDKWRTTVVLEQAGLPMPRTALALTPQAALDAMDELSYPVVIKPLVGSWGRLVAPLAGRAAAEAVLEYAAALPGPQSHVIYVQELIDKPDRDIRVIVVGGDVIGAVYRTSESMRTNVARGAGTSECRATPEITKFAVDAAAAVGAELAGVDLVEDRDGRLYVLEVNHRVEFSGFESALAGRVDVADRIVGHVLERADR